jgi:hypothetical protein
LGSNRPVCAHFSVKKGPDPLRRSGSGFIQEALASTNVYP